MATTTLRVTSDADCCTNLVTIEKVLYRHYTPTNYAYACPAKNFSLQQQHDRTIDVELGSGSAASHTPLGIFRQLGSTLASRP